MQITSVRLVNYRCFRDSGEVNLSKFSVLIGRNDGGKSSFLKAIDKALNQDGTFEADDCWFEVVNGEQQRSETLEVYIKFETRNFDKFHVRTTYSRIDNVILRHLEAQIVDEPDLNRDFTQLKKTELQGLCSRFDIEFKTSDTNPTLIAELKNYRDRLPKRDGWIQLPNEVASSLPKVNLYASVEETGPDKVITDNLNKYFRNELLDGHQKALTHVREEVETALNAHAKNTMLPALSTHCNIVQAVSIKLDESSFTALKVSKVLITQPDGKEIDWARIGSGKKREMALGIFRWEHEMLIDQIEDQTSEPTPTVVLFDEPDVNLDYAAQRLVNELLQDLAGKYPTTQVIVATHAVNIIDSVSVDCIRFFDNAEYRPWRFEYPVEENEQLERIRQSIGLSNSALFNENLIVVVEGPTEMAAIPRLYQHVTGKMLILSGVYLINGLDCEQALKLGTLLRKSGKKVIVLLDNDTKQRKKLFLHCEDADFKVNVQHQYSLKVDDDLFFVGSVEFEDTFDDTVWHQMLTSRFPVLAENASWVTDDIGSLRNGGKFSEGIQNLIEQKCLWKPGKPEIGQYIAEVAIQLEAIPESLKLILKHIEAKTS
ncbi:MAG: AAA family ATPase [Chloroflexi bacterium]|uniref:ATP-dependent nuclease n=1 Tax=Candidatus Flexifilum breve TaxID=3140694 RepID=UPI003136987E|nr:AAA family ATPase [Chloroflexota bacterium]